MKNASDFLLEQSVLICAGILVSFMVPAALLQIGTFYDMRYKNVKL